MADETTVRRRKPEPKTAKTTEPEPETESESSQDEKPKNAPKKAKKKTTQDHLDDDEAYSTSSLLLDILRVITFIALASCGLSYLISNGETFTWGMSKPPNYLRADWWKRQFVRFFPTSPFSLPPPLTKLSHPELTLQHRAAPST
jgi:hypothetical protein